MNYTCVIKELRCCEVKIEEVKAGSCRESNPGHLWLEPPVLCHWATTAGQLGSNRSKLLGNSSLILRGKGVYPRHSFYPYCAWVIWNKAAACTPTQKLCPGTLNISMGFLSNKKKAYKEMRITFMVLFHTCTQQSDDVMLSEIIWFHVLQPLLSAFCAVLESSLQR